MENFLGAVQKIKRTRSSYRWRSESVRLAFAYLSTAGWPSAGELSATIRRCSSRRDRALARPTDRPREHLAQAVPGARTSTRSHGRRDAKTASGCLGSIPPSGRGAEKARRTQEQILGNEPFGHRFLVIWYEKLQNPSTAPPRNALFRSAEGVTGSQIAWRTHRGVFRPSYSGHHPPGWSRWRAVGDER